ncbi:MAG: L-seryl-tRNA(Sec) selenium transferase [Anaerolineae bacterium]|nr:MAG: L-seryl-tRNA(Sec) selenium transferase [Anaerolineae bacterium]
MSLRNLPSVDALLLQSSALLASYGRPLTLQALRKTLEMARTHVRNGGEVPSTEVLLSWTASQLAQWTKPTLEPVINATGVILHTNLGRAPLSKSAIAAMLAASSGYSNLEFDLTTGKRGSRLIHAEALLKQLTGSEAAVVVNNCASAVLLVLSALAKGKRVIIARSQLVEIGGGFRIPDVMKQSGAKLLEIGTTNKTRLSDYEEALSANHFSATAFSPVSKSILMRAHRSNFRILGFTEEPSLREVADLAHQYQTILIDDLGSGTLIDVTRYGLAHEPTVQESLAAGADVVMFSGDKLLGGPQAGIILGRADLLSKIKKHPLARAVRADKTRLAALSATLLHYLKDEAEREIPIWQMIAQSPESLRARAEAWKTHLGCGEVVPSESTVGGGSLPGETLKTFVLSLAVQSASSVLERLRKYTPPVIARVENNRVLLDPRTVLPEQESTLLAALSATLGSTQRS